MQQIMVSRLADCTWYILANKLLGFTVVAFNRTVSKVDAFLANEAKGTKDQ